MMGAVRRWFGELTWAQWIVLGVTWGWALLVLSGPLLLPPGTATDLTGSVGRYDNGEVIAEMNPVARFVYWMGDWNCHQIRERSFFYHGNQMPFDSRSTSIFVGMALGLAVTLNRRWELSPLLLLAALVPIGLDGTIQLFTDYESTNLRRVITGLLAGGATGWALAFIVTELSGKAAMSQWEGPAVPQWEGQAVPEWEGPVVPEQERPAVPEWEGPVVPEQERPAVPERERPPR